MQQERGYGWRVSVSRLQDLIGRTDYCFCLLVKRGKQRNLDLSPILNNDFIPAG